MLALSQLIIKIFIKIKNFRNLADKKFIHTQIGFNSRLDTLQASILNNKLKLLNVYNNKRRKIAEKYNKLINKKIIKLFYSSGSVYHQYVIMINNRNALIKKLDKTKFNTDFIILCLLIN